MSLNSSYLNVVSTRKWKARVNMSSLEYILEKLHVPTSEAIGAKSQSNCACY